MLKHSSDSFDPQILTEFLPRPDIVLSPAETRGSESGTPWDKGIWLKTLWEYALTKNILLMPHEKQNTKLCIKIRPNSAFIIFLKTTREKKKKQKEEYQNVANVYLWLLGLPLLSLPEFSNVVIWLHITFTTKHSFPTVFKREGLSWFKLRSVSLLLPPAVPTAVPEGSWKKSSCLLLDVHIHAQAEPEGSAPGTAPQEPTGMTREQPQAGAPGGQGLCLLPGPPAEFIWDTWATPVKAGKSVVPWAQLMQMERAPWPGGGGLLVERK